MSLRNALRQDRFATNFTLRNLAKKVSSAFLELLFTALHKILLVSVCLIWGLELVSAPKILRRLEEFFLLQDKHLHLNCMFFCENGDMKLVIFLLKRKMLH